MSSIYPSLLLFSFSWFTYTPSLPHHLLGPDTTFVITFPSLSETINECVALRLLLGLRLPFRWLLGHLLVGGW